MVEFHQLVQEIAWIQESVTQMATRMPTATGSALKLICPPHLWWGDINISYGFAVTERTQVCEMTIANVQRAITPKVCNPELQFLGSARRP